MQTYRLVKLEGLVHLARESIDQEPTATVLPSGARVRFLEFRADGILEQLDGDLHGDDRPISNMFADKFTELGAFAILLLAQQVTSCYWLGTLRVSGDEMSLT